jgi:hypothetical protein
MKHSIMLYQRICKGTLMSYKLLETEYLDLFFYHSLVNKTIDFYIKSLRSTDPTLLRIFIKKRKFNNIFESKTRREIIF